MAGSGRYPVGMCVLAVFVDPAPGVRLVVAANRDEDPVRPSAPPARIDEERGIAAGRDLRSGGTWLGVNRAGLFLAVTNRHWPKTEAASLSRGLLALEALRGASLDGVRRLVEKRLQERPIAGFNLVAVARGAGMCFEWDGALRVVDFGAGGHVVSTNCDLDAPDLPEKRVFDRAFAGRDLPPDDDSLRLFLTDHSGDRPVCKHGERFGTVSSTIYVDAEAGRRLLHAEGPPCSTTFRDFSALVS